MPLTYEEAVDGVGRVEVQIEAPTGILKRVESPDRCVVSLNGGGELDTTLDAVSATKPRTSAGRLDAVAKECGLAADWRESLLDRQRLVVAVLQNRLRSDADLSGAGTCVPSGQVKDIAIALGVATDKLDNLS